MSRYQIFAQKEIILDSEAISYNCQQVALGSDALSSVTTGADNVAVATGALSDLTTGDGNIAIGVDAGSAYTTESNNITIGNTGTAADSAVIRIGDDTQTTCYIAGVSGVTSAAAVAVYCNASGKFGTVVSSERFKEEIEDFTLQEAEKLYELNPKRFKRKGDPTREVHRGVIAEEAVSCQPDLVVYDEKGQFFSFQYDKLHANYIALHKQAYFERMAEKKRVDELKKDFEALKQAVSTLLS